MTEPGVFPQTPKPAADEIRRLLVHPAAWPALESYLRSVRLAVLPMPAEVDQLPTYCMTPMDGDWGGPDVA